MGIRQKSAHGVIIQEDFRKCNFWRGLGGFRPNTEMVGKDGFRRIIVRSNAMHNTHGKPSEFLLTWSVAVLLPALMTLVCLSIILALVYGREWLSLLKPILWIAVAVVVGTWFLGFLFRMMFGERVEEPLCVSVFLVGSALWGLSGIVALGLMEKKGLTVPTDGIDGTVSLVHRLLTPVVGGPIAAAIALGIGYLLLRWCERLISEPDGPANGSQPSRSE